MTMADRPHTPALGGRMRSRSALVVEDEYPIALDLKELLESDGWRVIGPASNCAEAQRLIATERPSITLLDLVLNGVFATDVVRALNMIGVPTILVTGWDNLEQVDGKLLAGLPVIRKPIDSDVLLHMVNAIAGPDERRVPKRDRSSVGWSEFSLREER